MDAKYNIDAARMKLTKLEKSIRARELVPSRRALKTGLKDAFGKLKAMGIANLQELLDALKNKAKVTAVAKKAGLSVEYLTLLRREANSYLPKPVRLSTFPGISKQVIAKLERSGITNTKHLFERTRTQSELAQLCKATGISTSNLTELAKLSDLARLYGVGPVFAKMLLGLGIDSVQAFVKLEAKEVISLYEQETQKKADFAESDIDFTLELAKHLDC